MTLSAIIRVVIIDGDARVRQQVEQFLKIQPGAIIVGTCGSVQEAVILIRATSPDLVMLAVSLSDGSAFDVLKAMAPVSCKVIFLAAGKDEVTRAARFGPTVLKPVDEEELLQAMEVAVAAIGDQGNIRRQQKPRLQQRLLLRTQQYLQPVSLGEIIYFQGGEAYTTVYLTEGRKVFTSKYLKEYEDVLPQSRFLRPHQSYIVNVDFIEKFLREGTLILRNGSKIVVPSRRREQVLKYLEG